MMDDATNGPAEEKNGARGGVWLGVVLLATAVLLAIYLILTG
jgi:hypothetical protein